MFDNYFNIFTWIDKHIESIKLRYLPNHAHSVIYKFVHVRVSGFLIISSYSILSLSSSLAPTFQTGCHRRPPWQCLCGETRPCLCTGSTAPSILWSHPTCGNFAEKIFRSEGSSILLVKCQLLQRTYHPFKSLSSLFACSISCSSLPVRASGLVWAYFSKISSSFSGTNLQVDRYCN